MDYVERSKLFWQFFDSKLRPKIDPSLRQKKATVLPLQWFSLLQSHVCWCQVSWIILANRGMINAPGFLLAFGLRNLIQRIVGTCHFLRMNVQHVKKDTLTFHISNSSTSNISIVQSLSLKALISIWIPRIPKRKCAKQWVLQCHPLCFDDGKCVTDSSSTMSNAFDLSLFVLKAFWSFLSVCE